MTFKKGHVTWSQGLTKETDERVRRIAEAKKGKPCSEETRRKISEANKGKVSWSKGLTKENNESVRLVSEAKKGKKNPMYGRPPSKETRRKLSEALKGYRHTEEARKRMSEAQKGRTFSEEHRRKLSDSQKGKQHSDESRRKISEALKGAKSPNWRGGIYHRKYGENWRMQRLSALRRDEYTCQKCSKTRDEIRIGVHHIIPFRCFKDYNEANELKNLKTLCYPCHGEADSMFRREEISLLSQEAVFPEIAA